MLWSSSLLAATLLLASSDVALSLKPAILNGPADVVSWRIPKRLRAARPEIAGQALAAAAQFPSFNFTQPWDHFNKKDNRTFGQRYYVSARHYKPGGPVIVLDGGETSVEDRIPYLDTGIVDLLAKETNGLGIILEHRYYGTSIPVPDFSTDNMRWLTNDQALEDSAQFIRHFKWNGTDLSGPKTKWIYYGGSYAGARSAHMRVVYPDIVYGAIASSGVTYAIADYWQYADAVRRTANQSCTGLLTAAVHAIDDALASKRASDRSAIKAKFGLQNLTDSDFGNLISSVVGYPQGLNWDPAVSDDSWYQFCAQLGSGKAATGKSVAERTKAAIDNYAKWIKEEYVDSCTKSSTVQSCFALNPQNYKDTSLKADYKAWMWQYCTTWGFFQPSPPDPKTPRIISLAVDLNYTSIPCQYAFAPGKYVRLPKSPRVEEVNKLGGLHIAKDRLAIVDGYADPWRPATPHSPQAPKRRDTTLRPFKLIGDGAVHHWDENGLKNGTKAEPKSIRAIHEQEVAFVKSWLGL